MIAKRSGAWRPVELEVEHVRIAGEDGEEGCPLSSSHVLRVPRLPEFTGGPESCRRRAVWRCWRLRAQLPNARETELAARKALEK